MMPPSQAEFEALLQRLRTGGTESRTADGKQDLHLCTKGDRAYFIQHVAALANNADPSYMIIGVEDKTWKGIGLPSASPLRSADDTQQQMNQILANRLDPNLSVAYGTYSAAGCDYGLVVIEGTRAPYIVAIEDQEYGGERTRGAPCNVHRGSIYIRHGARSIIANRQSDILGILDGTAGKTEPSAVETFLADHNYLELCSPEFGHHQLTSRLEEVHVADGSPRGEFAKAESWVAVLCYPIKASCDVDTVALRGKLRPDQRIGRGPQWYEGLPRQVNDMLFKARGSPLQLTAESPGHGENRISSFFLVQPSGPIEVVCVHRLFIQHRGARLYHFVNVVGFLWQMICLARAVYYDVGYEGNVQTMVNLVGAKNTILDGFAKSRGGWASPFDGVYDLTAQDVCQDPSIQIARALQLGKSTDEEIERVVRSIAADIGAYYGQDRPRCFDYHTEEFPVRQYTSRMQ